MERFLGQLFLPTLLSSSAFGRNQFAYCPGRGARDAVLYFLLVWLSAMASGNRIGVFCADVSGAFDRVCSRRLLAKLAAAGVHTRVLRVLQSWSAPRTAKVVVRGASSSPLEM
eukprot:15073507-Alexandrium_andersonii.AAC.1